MNDEQLLTKAKALDPLALQTLHQRFYESVARYIQSKIGDARAVEDLSGEVFVRVIESLRKGHSWHTSPRSWIMGIAHHLIVDYYRKRERLVEVKLGDYLTSSQESDPVHQTLINERKRVLMRFVDQLTVDQRDVILLRFIEGFDIKEVSEIINKTPGAVKALQYRAVRILAQKMQGLSLSA